MAKKSLDRSHKGFKPLEYDLEPLGDIGRIFSWEELVGMPFHKMTINLAILGKYRTHNYNIKGLFSRPLFSYTLEDREGCFEIRYDDNLFIKLNLNSFDFVIPTADGLDLERGSSYGSVEAMLWIPNPVPEYVTEF